MLKNWWFSLSMLLVYVATFLAWKHYPSRASFLAVGLFSAVVLAMGMVVAARRGYFAGMTDTLLHAYVIVDLLLETFMYEFFLAAIVWLGIVPAIAPRDGSGLPGLLAFHNNNNFYFCALFFVVVIGSHRLWALRTTRRSPSPAS